MTGAANALTQPRLRTDRNVHGKIFGGWLMRRAFETAFACGWRTSGVPPRFLSLSDITFVAPVEIGSLVQFEAQVRAPTCRATGRRAAGEPARELGPALS